MVSLTIPTLVQPDQPLASCEMCVSLQSEMCVSLQIVNLPIIAAFAGLTVGCVPFLKGLLFGPDAPLGFIRDCLEVKILSWPISEVVDYHGCPHTCCLHPLWQQEHCEVREKRT